MPLMSAFSNVSSKNHGLSQINTVTEPAVIHATSTGMHAYKWNSTSGYGTKYPAPALNASVDTSAVATHPSKNVVVAGLTNSPGIAAYRWDGGFGIRYADPSTLPTDATTRSVKFSPDGNYVACVHFSSPRVSAYPWTFTSGFGTKLANPATLPTSVGVGLAFNAAGTVIAVGQGGTTPFIAAYPWSAGFGAKYANPTTLPPGATHSVTFNAAGTAIAASSDTTPYINAWSWSSGFGSKYANPATLPSVNPYGYGIAFSPDGTTISMSGGASLNTYAWSAGFGTIYSGTVSGGSMGVVFNSSSTVLFSDGSAIRWTSGVGYGTAYSAPSPAVPSTNNCWGSGVALIE